MIVNTMEYRVGLVEMYLGLKAIEIKKCPECKSKDIGIYGYPDGERFLECNCCYSVIADIKEPK